MWLDCVTFPCTECSIVCSSLSTFSSLFRTCFFLIVRLLKATRSVIDTAFLLITVVIKLIKYSYSFYVTYVDAFVLKLELTRGGGAKVHN